MTYISHDVFSYKIIEYISDKITFLKLILIINTKQYNSNICYLNILYKSIRKINKHFNKFEIKRLIKYCLYADNNYYVNFLKYHKLNDNQIIYINDCIGFTLSNIIISIYETNILNINDDVVFIAEIYDILYNILYNNQQNDDCWLFICEYLIFTFNLRQINHRSLISKKLYISILLSTYININEIKHIFNIIIKHKLYNDYGISLRICEKNIIDNLHINVFDIFKNSNYRKINMVVSDKYRKKSNKFNIGKRVINKKSKFYRRHYLTFKILNYYQYIDITYTIIEFNKTINKLIQFIIKIHKYINNISKLHIKIGAYTKMYITIIIDYIKEFNSNKNINKKIIDNLAFIRSKIKNWKKHSKVKNFVEKYLIDIHYKIE